MIMSRHGVIGTSHVSLFIALLHLKIDNWLSKSQNKQITNLATCKWRNKQTNVWTGRRLDSETKELMVGLKCGGGGGGVGGRENRTDYAWRRNCRIKYSKRTAYNPLAPCGHLAITDTPIVWTVAKSPAKINYRRLTEINFRYYWQGVDRTRKVFTSTCY